jgi:tetratricopeptide (TPR) repeat protein
MRKDIILGLILITALCVAPMAICNEGFPGIGDPGGWSDALPYYNGGNRYLNAGRFADAIERYKQAIARYQYEPDFYINLGVAYRKLEDYANAEQAFLQATKLSPKDWMGWSNLGNAYLKQNKLKETVASFQSALKCNPPLSEAVAIKRDIADITKIMNMQGGKTATSAVQVKPESSIKHSAEEKRSPKPLLPAQSPAATAPSAARLSPEEKKQAEKSGWDWIESR